jgi:tetratricopeptide (TPR) repeat protein
MNIRTYIDDELRIRPTSTKKLAMALPRERETLLRMREEAENDPSTLNISHLGRACARLSDHLWLDGQWEAAVELGEEALDIWQELERGKAAFLQRLKLAEYHVAMGEADLDALEDLVAESEDESLSVYRDFALEALARRAYRVGDYKRALGAIEAALELRRERGNTTQIEQTEDIRRTILAAVSEQS